MLQLDNNESWCQQPPTVNARTETSTLECLQTWSQGLLIKTTSFTSANRNKFGIQIVVFWGMTLYVLVGVPMYWRNMLPPSLGSKWVGRECSQMEACPTDNFYHSNHFNPEKMAACFSKIFVNITWRLQPEYTLLCKQMLCMGHNDNSCYKSLTQRHWERLSTFSVMHIISFPPLCKRNSVT
jgi:hypothetical protein